MIAGVVAGGRPLTAVVAADPHWASVASLLHLDGAHGGTTFTDEVAGTTWSRAGNAVLDSSQAKFGASSASFDGSGDRLAGTSGSLVFGTADFTIEFFVRPSSATPGGGRWIISPVFAPDAWYAFGYNPTTKQFVAAGQTGTGQLPYTADEWHHVAIVRSSGVLTIYINGVSMGGRANTQNYASSTLYVGGTDTNISAVSSWLIGHIDELRVTNGVARYTANFTPPTAAFPSS